MELNMRQKHFFKTAYGVPKIIKSIFLALFGNIKCNFHL